jgi:hypothetical protein
MNDTTSIVGQIGFRRVFTEGDSTNIVPRIVIAGRWKLGGQ